jgi:hypothetical protein
MQLEHSGLAVHGVPGHKHRLQLLVGVFAAVNANHDSAVNAVSGGRRRESSPQDHRRRSPSRQGRSRQKTPGPYRDDSDICYYHITYGEQARKCKPGCQWVPGKDAPKTLEWPPAAAAAFGAAKAALAAAVPLAHPAAASSPPGSAGHRWPRPLHRWSGLAYSASGARSLHPVHLQPTEIPVPHRRFAHLHVDLVGPLPPSRGHTYLFTIIDRTSRWPEPIPLASITAADCARAFFAGWVSRFGVAATITSDRGAQFTSALWAGLCSLLNIQHLPTTAYHPQSNGLVERFHRRLKDALRSRASAADWHDHLPWVLLGIKTAFREDSEFSPAEAVYSSQLVLPGQFIDTAESPSPTFL